MFDKIVESVLNEISAEDAYNKFYNTLPRDAFFNLVNEYGKFDNLMKFVMNAISENKNRFEDAANFVKLYKTAKNESRIAFLKNFKEGKYDDITDLIYALKEFEENGVETLKKFQEGGLVIVRDDEELRITYTTTYEANHHFYGKSSWCTASDRLGRFDGWLYFLSYILGVEYVEVKENYEDLQYYDVDNCLLQITEKKQNKTYQLQVDEYGDVGTACDFSDKSVSTTIYSNVINHLRENGILKGAISETGAAFLREYPYQRKKDEYILPKREKRERMIEEMEENLRNQSITSAENKKPFITQQVNKVFNSNLLEDASFIERIVKFTNKCQNCFEKTDEIAKEFEEEAKAIGYLSVSESTMVNEHVFTIKLTPIFGIVKDIVYDQNGMPTLGDIFNDENWHYEVDLDTQEVCLIVYTEYHQKNNRNGFYGHIQDDDNVKILKILKSIKHNNDNISCDMSRIGEVIAFTKKPYDLDYIRISDYSSFGSSDKKRSLFNLKYNKTIDIDFYPSKEIIYDDFTFIIGESKGVVINNNTLETLKIDYVEYVDNSTRACLSLFGKNDACFYSGINEKDGNLYLFVDDVVRIGKVGTRYYAMIPSDQISYYNQSKIIPKYVLIADTNDNWKYKYFFANKKVVKNSRIKTGG